MTENTVDAFERALADGADGVELDVQRCRSGEVIVFHDEDLARLAHRTERIRDLSLAALRGVSLRGGGRIPTLAEVLEACGKRALVNIEIKYDGLRPSGCAELVAAVAQVTAAATADVLVSSFSPAVLWVWLRQYASAPCGLLFEPARVLRRPWPLRTEWSLPLLRPAAVHPHHSLCTPKSVAAWHRQSYAVNVWTVDEPERIRQLADMGVDAIITNDPKAARLTLGSAAG